MKKSKIVPVILLASYILSGYVMINVDKMIHMPSKLIAEDEAKTKPDKRKGAR